MKRILTIFICLLSLNVYASKIACIWLGGNEGKRGDSLTAFVSAEQIIISGHSWAGTYPRVKDEDVKGRDGNTYYSYNSGYNDGTNRILVDQRLVNYRATGLLKFRGRGEGFFEQRFFCTG